MEMKTSKLRTITFSTLDQMRNLDIKRAYITFECLGRFQGPLLCVCYDAACGLLNTFTNRTTKSNSLQTIQI